MNDIIIVTTTVEIDASEYEQNEIPGDSFFFNIEEHAITT